MKKIMFDDKYGLTKAVLEGRKTMTRRLPDKNWRCVMSGIAGRDLSKVSTPYKVGDVVAVAQSYKDVYAKGIEKDERYESYRNIYGNAVGWTNKMFVLAELMPHHIRITNVRVERLQDISDDDCVREGIQWANGGFYSYYNHLTGARLWLSGKSPQKAFAELFDRLSGKGTWKSNPWVFVYEFELVK